jgi:uncharacterized protein involved in high-affinity Fe2+ transport
MRRTTRTRRRTRAGRAARLAAPLILAAALLAGCGSATQTTLTAAVTTTASGATGMPGMNMSGGATGNTGANASKEASVDGIKPVPTQKLATADWQGMKIQAMAMTAVPFVVFNGSKEQMVKVPKHTSFHLMVMLNDAHSGVAIPYASVWATISKAGKVVYDERQWPMLSEYMGPHYGNDVSLPGPGSYQLSLLISPPVSARHVEYEHVWLKPHRVTTTFNWRPAT